MATLIAALDAAFRSPRRLARLPGSLERNVDHLAHVLAVRGRNRQRLAERQLVEFGDRALGVSPSALFTARTTGRPDRRSSSAIVAVLRREARRGHRR